MFPSLRTHCSVYWIVGPLYVASRLMCKRIDVAREITAQPSRVAFPALRCWQSDCFRKSSRAHVVVDYITWAALQHRSDVLAVEQSVGVHAKCNLASQGDKVNIHLIACSMSSFIPNRDIPK